MNKHPALQEIIVCCTLLAMKGVIPSLLDFQQQLQQHITRYCKELAEKGYAQHEIDAVRRLLCCVIDALATRDLAAQGLSWKPYQLTPLFYGYPDNTLFTMAQGEALANTTHPELREAARTICALSPQPLPGLTPQPAVSHAIPVVETEESYEVDESPERTDAVPAPAIRWGALMGQVALSGLLLTLIWYGCHLLQNGGI